MTDEPRGPRTHAIPLPEGRRLRRAIESLGLGAQISRPGGRPNPMGERGDAAQYLGVLKGLVAQMEEGLRGGPLHHDVTKGFFASYGRDNASLLAGIAAELRLLTGFAGGGITGLPFASQQMSVASTALLAASHAFAAAAEIAVGPGSDAFDENEIVKQSEAMYAAADMLRAYVADKREQWTQEENDEAPPAGG